LCDYQCTLDIIDLPVDEQTCDASSLRPPTDHRSGIVPLGSQDIAPLANSGLTLGLHKEAGRRLEPKKTLDCVPDELEFTIDSFDDDLDLENLLTDV